MYLHTLDVAYQLISTKDKSFMLIMSDDESCVGGVSVSLLMKVEQEKCHNRVITCRKVAYEQLENNVNSVLCRNTVSKAILV
jgi:hypothetical protein